jgi:hypothetical protein
MKITGTIATYSFKNFSEMLDFLTKGKNAKKRYIKHKDGREIAIMKNGDYAKNELWLENEVGAWYAENPDGDCFTNLTELEINGDFDWEYNIADFVGYEKIGKKALADEIFIMEVDEVDGTCHDTYRECYKTRNGAIKGALDYMSRFYRFGNTVTEKPYITEEKLKELQTALEKGLKGHGTSWDDGTVYTDEYGNEKETNVTYHVHTEKILD